MNDPNFFCREKYILAILPLCDDPDNSNATNEEEADIRAKLAGLIGIPELQQLSDIPNELMASALYRNLFELFELTKLDRHWNRRMELVELIERAQITQIAEIIDHRPLPQFNALINLYPELKIKVLEYQNNTYIAGAGLITLPWIRASLIEKVERKARMAASN